MNKDVKAKVLRIIENGMVVSETLRKSIIYTVLTTKEKVPTVVVYNGWGESRYRVRLNNKVVLSVQWSDEPFNINITPDERDALEIVNACIKKYQQRIAQKKVKKK